MARHSFIQDLGRRWDGIRAGWPILLVPFVASLLVTLTGQGREVLYAMLRQPLWPFTAFILCGLLLHVRFVNAINEHYPFSADAIHSTRPIPLPALFAAASMPMVFGLFYLWHAVNLRHPGNFQSHVLEGFLGCTLVVLLLALWHFGLASRWLVRVFQTHLSRFVVWSSWVQFAQRGLLTALFLASIVIWWFPALASEVGPVTVFALAMAIWAVVANLAVVAIARRESLPPPALAALGLIAALVFFAWLFGDVRYPVDEVVCDPHSSCAPLPAEKAAEAWLHSRAGENPTNAIVVIADGGGIRQALETATVLAELDERTKGRFFRHVYALSGVSGGALGIATWLAARAEYLPAQNWRAVSDDVAQTLKSDHFSPLLAGLLFHDIPLMFVPTVHLPWLPAGLLPNRGELFEASLREGWAGGGELNRPFGQAIADASRDTPSPPVVLFNTTLANLGRIATVSNVRFSDSATPLCNVLDEIGTKETVKLVTAAHISARFPITNPPAEIEVEKAGRRNDPCGFDADTRLAFVDGAYADNTGADAALNAIDALNAAAKRLGHRRLQIVVLHVYASTTNPEDRKEIKQAGESDRALDDLLIPVRAEGLVQYELGLAPLEVLCAETVRINSGTPEGTPEGIEKCDNIGLSQSRLSNDIRTPVNGLWDCASRLMWLNAALDISQDAAKEDYVPLGWMLGPGAEHVTKASERIANDATRFITPLISDANSAPPQTCR
jgi:hypothetical protein